MYFQITLMIPTDLLKKHEGPKISTFFKTGMPNVDGPNDHAEDYAKSSYGGSIRKFDGDSEKKGV
jgi:hypothetical protein